MVGLFGVRFGQWGLGPAGIGVLLLLPVCAAADYLRPGQAGFHHCALIYERTQRTADDLLCYVARVRQGKPVEWLFDSLLFLRFSMPSGVRTDEGPMTQADWQRHLDDWFSPGRDLSALDEAVERASAVLGKPPAPRTVMLSIPYPNPRVHGFRLPDGSAVHLGTEEGLERAARWYVQEAARRFQRANYRHLRLWGFYWMR